MEWRNNNGLGSNTNENRLIDIALFQEPMEGEMARAYLDSQGIKCALTDSITNNLFGGALDSSPSRLMVQASDLEEARRILKKGGYSTFISEPEED